MNELRKERIFYYFEKISAIPRESGYEKEVSDWIFNWAKKLGLEAAQDAAFNLVIRKKSSEGFEKAESVILQAHMDMVCEKPPDSLHDFKNDPILLKREGDWLVSACQTSLGADNGIGIAYAMTILEDSSLVHPELEVIFTVEEETTFKGADSVDVSRLKSRRMINLDHSDEKELIAGSCGGTGVTFDMPVEWEDHVPEGYSPYILRITGLKGGHSGEDIHRGRGNAIQLMMRVLRKMTKEGCRVCSVCGGTNRLAICRAAEAVVLSDDPEKLMADTEDIKQCLVKEFGTSAPNLNITIEKLDVKCPEKSFFYPIKKDMFEKIETAVRLFPDGIQCMSGDFCGLVNSSNNLGIIRTDYRTGSLQIISEIRGLYQSMVDDIKDKIETLASLLGAGVNYFADYVSWEYKQQSALRRTALKVYEDLFGEEMKVSTVHAGLEGGSFQAKLPEMDIISVGPDCQFFHSPMERVSISSVRKCYQFLTKLLADLS